MTIVQLITVFFIGLTNSHGILEYDISVYCYDGICARLVNREASWADAEDYCHYTHNGNLLAFSSVEQWQELKLWLIRWFSNPKGYSWVGVGRMCPSESSQDKPDSWSNGLTVDWAIFNLSKADRLNSSMCAAVQILDDKVKPIWRDCSQPNNFLCMTDRMSNLSSTQSPASPYSMIYGRHESSWCPLKSAASLASVQPSYLLVTQPRSWYEAKQYCHSRLSGSELASIHSTEQLNMLRSMITFRNRSDVWIGLSRRAMTEFDYRWTDGSRLDFILPVLVSDNSTTEGLDRCVTINVTNPDNTGWQALDCHTRLPFLCQRDVNANLLRKNASSNLTAATTTECGKGWHRFGSACYLVVGVDATKDRKTFADAKTHCSQNRGFLTGVNDPYEQAFLVTQAPNAKAWIGLQIINGQLKWIDDRAYSIYTNFDAHSIEVAKRKPDASTLADVYMSDSDGKWVPNFNADPKLKLPFVCKHHINGSSQKDTPEFTLLHHQESKSWDEAQKSCEAHAKAALLLPTIHDEYEWSVFVTNLRNGDYVNETAWLGLRRNETSRLFEWVDKSQFGFSRWAAFEPRDSASDDLCVAVDVGRSLLVDMAVGLNPPVMRTLPCADKLPYICASRSDRGPKASNTTTATYCPFGEGWVHGETHCYHYLHQLPQPAYRYNSPCKINFNSVPGVGHAVILTTGDQDAAVRAMNQSIDAAYIGLQITAEGHQFWEDASTVSYTNWHFSQYLNTIERHEHSERCVALARITAYKWFTAPCDRVFGHLCSAPISDHKPTQPASTATVEPSQASTAVATSGAKLTDASAKPTAPVASPTTQKEGGSTAATQKLSTVTPAITLPENVTKSVKGATAAAGSASESRPSGFLSGVVWLFVGMFLVSMCVAAVVVARRRHRGRRDLFGSDVAFITLNDADSGL